MKLIVSIPLEVYGFLYYYMAPRSKIDKGDSLHPSSFCVKKITQLKRRKNHAQNPRRRGDCRHALMV